MKMNRPDNIASLAESAAKLAGVLELPVNQTVSAMMGPLVAQEPVGLLAAGIDPRSMVLGLLAVPDFRELFEPDSDTLFPQAAKRKLEDDADEEEESSDDEDVAGDDDAEEEEEDDDLEDDDEEDEEDDEDEEEEDDEFDDPDDDDDFDDDDDDEDDFDDEE